MSDSTTIDDYADRRRHFRHSVHRTAELMLRGASDGIGCTVLDQSTGGVQVELSEAVDLPEEVVIKFSDTASQLVRRCWAKGTKVGYQYIEIVPAQLRFPGEVPPPPAQAGSTALNDFIDISRTLLDLSGPPGAWLYPAEQIHALLADIPHAQLQMEHRGPDGRKMLQLFAIPWVGEGKPGEARRN